MTKHWTKVCFKCGLHLPETEFYKHPMMGDGRLGKCKTCTKSDVRMHREQNLESIRAYDRRRGKKPHRIANAIRVAKRWHHKHPGRAAAHLAARRALRIPPSMCERCQQTGLRLERHHPDYSQPVLIEWLCKPCHCVADRERRQREADAVTQTREDRDNGQAEHRGQHADV